MSSQDKVLAFWFGATDAPDYGKSRQAWFTKDLEFDRQIKTQFLADYELAAAGKLDFWQADPLGCLALLVLLDQFPRNMFRGTAQAFATDPQALAIAKSAVERGCDRQLLPIQRLFIYLPFEHSEQLADQQLSMALFRQLAAEVPDFINFVDYARRHLEIIERFGRFPHRNQILGRASTVAEIEFLNQPGSSF